MKDHDGLIFYVGKAKNLRARLRSYFSGQDERLFVQYLDHMLADIDIILVRNNKEALILERELIQKHKPRFNILLRDDKNYILLKLKKAKEQGRKKDRYPRLEIVRQSKKDGARYFGPYPSAASVRATAELINKYFLLRNCQDNIIDNRTRPCIQYQIGRCLAPCVFTIDNYEEELENVALFLSGSYKPIKKKLKEKMWQLAESENYEAAAKVRDQIDAIEQALVSQVISEVNRKRDQDIIALARSGAHVEIIQMFIRQGSWHRSRNIALSEQPFPSEEILRAFVLEAYSDCLDLPHDIFLSLPISDELHGLKQLLEEKQERQLRILCPQKGKALRLVEIAQKNAENALHERIRLMNIEEQGLIALKERLSLAIKPERIECVDISLIQGSDAFGSLVTFINGKADKKLYRTYRIKSVPGMDDFAMIYEVVKRRMSHGIRHGDLPDLLLVDGGKGQLSAALRAINDCNILLAKDGLFVAGIAKARVKKESDKESVEHSDERLFVPEKSEAIMLKAHSPERYLVERIRDEAHRFALKAHRRSRQKRNLRSQLLDAPGIGKKRALKLLQTFGSVKNIVNTKDCELAKSAGISLKAAQKLLDFLKQLPN